MADRSSKPSKLMDRDSRGRERNPEGRHMIGVYNNISPASKSKLRNHIIIINQLTWTLQTIGI